mgnify:FL=1
MAIKTISCVVCEVDFNGSSNAMYCSSKCKQKSHRSKSVTSGFIYLLKNKGKVVYVGSSATEKTLKARVTIHKAGEYPKCFDDYDYYKVDGDVLVDVETEEIIRRRPIYNHSLPSKTLYTTPKILSQAMISMIEDAIKERFTTYSLAGSRAKKITYIKTSDTEAVKSDILGLLSNKSNEALNDGVCQKKNKG